MSKYIIRLFLLCCAISSLLSACSNIDDDITGSYSGYTVATGNDNWSSADDGARLVISASSARLESPVWGDAYIPSYSRDDLADDLSGINGKGTLTLPSGDVYSVSMTCKVVNGGSDATCSLAVSGHSVVKYIRFLKGDMPVAYAPVGLYSGMAYVSVNNVEVAKSTASASIIYASDNTVTITLGSISSDSVSVGSITCYDVAVRTSSSGGYSLGQTKVSDSSTLINGSRTAIDGTLAKTEIDSDGNLTLSYSLFIGSDNVPMSIVAYLKAE